MLATLAVGPGTGAEVLAETGPDAELSIAGPFGAFTLPAGPAVFLIGAGTGVAPLRALGAEEALGAEGSTLLVLLVGARSEDDLLWHDELTTAAERSSRFRYEPVLSQPSVAWRGRRGHVQDHLPELTRELPASVAVRICGSATMVEAAVHTLHELGIPIAAIQTRESY